MVFIRSMMNYHGFSRSSGEIQQMRINKGTAFAILVVMGYVGFEGYAIYQVKDRTKPDYIYGLLIQAKIATEACDSERLVFREKFEKTLERVTGNFRRQLEDANPDAAPTEINQLMAAFVVKSESATKKELSSMSCDSQTMKNHFQRYRLYARKSR